MHHFFWKQDAFEKRLEVMVRKDKVVEVVINEGWYTEQEMHQDLKWGACWA